MREQQERRLKVLWIARTCPYPANDGEKLRVFNLLKAVAQQHDLTIVYRVMAADEKQGAAELDRFCTGGAHGIEVPRPQGLLGKLRWLLPFVFSRYPIALCTVYFQPIRQRLAELAARERFDVVQVEHSSLDIYLDHVQFPSRPATVLTLHNIDYVRNERVLQNTPFGPARLYHWFNQRRFKTWELKAISRYDRVIAMSDIDRGILLKDLPDLPVDVVPNGVDARAIAYQPAPEASETVIFVASMDSEANHDGAMFFVRDIWPLVKAARPSAVLKLVGRGPNPELQAQHNGRDIIVTGKVADVLGYYREAGVAVVPLRSGGGTRLKILEAMAAGAAVVSTTVGCEGLDVSDGQDILIQDEPRSFADAVLRLLGDLTGRRALQQAARHLVETRYDWTLIGQQQDRVYSEALRAHERH
jgi:glycosyltransferase involved in cell wall biosynthesis